MSGDKGIITLAFGMPKYVEMAKTLARSLILHSPNIPRAIVTDCTDDPQLSVLFDTVINRNEEFGTNVRQKLFLDQYSPYSKTLFIDSDCIVSADIEFIFEDLAGADFTVPRNEILVAGQKDPFVDVDKVLQHFGFSSIPKFNGGLYYFEKNERSSRVFESARDVTLHEQKMFDDRGKMMRTPIGLRGPFDIDVVAGKNTFQKHASVVSPAVIHFAGEWSEHPLYYRETIRLKSIIEGQGDVKKPLRFMGLQLKFGYQIALVRFVGKRILRNPMYIKRLVSKVWS